MSKWTRKGKRAGKRGVSFNPNRNYINSAVEEYLKEGGKITKIEIDDESYQEFVKIRDAVSTDEFLNGNGL